MIDSRLEPDRFWVVYEIKTKGKSKKEIKFKLNEYLLWLQGEGFYRKESRGDSFMLVYIDKNIVRQVDEAFVRFYILTYFRSLRGDNLKGVNNDFIIDWYGNNLNKMICKAVFDLLEGINVDFYRDTLDKGAIFFSNGVVCLERGEDFKIIPYSEFDGKIWEEQVVERDIKLLNSKKVSVFEKFLGNVFGDNAENISAVKSAIGYLLHNYKPTSYAPAIVLNDKIISDNPEGGTGKGLIAKAIGEFRNSTTLDGKSFDFNKSFVFQRVELFTDMLVFDDVKSNFSFEKLFSIITEGITVEKKNQGEFFIPFEHSPKILITTNYALKGDGNSIERRKVDFELEQYYTKEFTPRDEFGQSFFSSEWSEQEWNVFYMFMLGCVQLYLDKGLIMPKNLNLAEKRLEANTHPAFIDFMTESIRLGNVYSKQQILKLFVDTTNLKHVTSRTLTSWIKVYCEFHKIEYQEPRTRGQRMIKVGYLEQGETRTLDDVNKEFTDASANRKRIMGKLN